MISRTPKLFVVVLAVLALSACSGAAGADEASSASGGMIVTFTADGAAVFHELTEQAVGAGDQARLVIRIGGELQC